MTGVVSLLLGILTSAIVLTFLLSHLSWWILGEKYFPSSRVCAYVHWNFTSWFSREKVFFKSHMEKVTVFGFIGTIFLFGIVSLNVTILAQIFDLFVENQQTVTLPILGEYGIFPLLVGLLFALVEVALSAVVDFRKSLKQSYGGIIAVLVLMIVVEAGLNIYRSMIMAGDPGIVRTFWDNILGISGPLLAGFLGLVVPLATIILGAYAMMEFIIPMINNTAIALRSVLLFVVYGILVFLFAWHPKRPLKIPESVRRLHEEAAQFRKQGDGLSAQFKLLQNIVQRMKKQTGPVELPTEDDLKKIQGELGALEKQVATKKPVRSKKTGLLYYHDIKTRPDLRHAIDDTCDQIREFKTTANTEKRKIASMSQKIKRRNESDKELQNAGDQYEKALETVRTLLSALQQGLQDSKISEFSDAIHAAISGRPVADGILSVAETEELIALSNPAKTLDELQKDYTRATADLCRSMVASARTDIRQAGKMTQDVQEWLTKHGVQGEIANNTVADHRLDELETLVVELADRMQKCEQTMNSQFDAMQNELKILAWQLYAFIKWFELQTSLRKRV
jgi:hypothetical protein